MRASERQRSNALFCRQKALNRLDKLTGLRAHAPRLPERLGESKAQSPR